MIPINYNAELAEIVFETSGYLTSLPLEYS